MNNKIKITTKKFISIGLLSGLSIATVTACQTKISQVAKERFEKAYFTTDEGTYYLTDVLYAIINDDEINICEKAVTLEKDYSKLEEYGYMMYESIEEIPNETRDYIFSSLMPYTITNEDGKHILQMKTDADYYFLQPGSISNGVSGYCLTIEPESFYDVATGEFVSPVININRKADEQALMDWIVPDKALIFNTDDEFTYDEIKGYAKTYFKKIKRLSRNE